MMQRERERARMAATADDDESDSDVSVESDEDVPGSKIRQLVQEAKQHKKKKRRLN